MHWRACCLIVCFLYLPTHRPVFAQSSDTTTTNGDADVSDRPLELQSPAAASITPAQTSSNTTDSNTVSHVSSTADKKATTTHIPPSPHHPVHSPTVTRRPVPTPTHTETFTPASPTPIHSSPVPRRRHRQAPAAIAFEVIGGLFGMVLVLLVMRFVYSWRKTPSRDRVAAFVNRHRLEREMAEASRVEPRRPVWRPPPPPYMPPPPRYEAVHGSPPPSPPMQPVFIGAEASSSHNDVRTHGHAGSQET
ncbi:hypothetical protein PLICRDRAFT_25637 [Plicaturopsis crispa FD-325 SS-3]|nr:hypothetical protein PLICRDRAFT_25637 [Plicaturopsis crispa FD-325 SS-3]